MRKLIADLILVLEDGIIPERGSHEELLRREGLYADLYRKQLLEQEIAELQGMGKQRKVAFLNWNPMNSPMKYVIFIPICSRL